MMKLISFFIIVVGVVWSINNACAQVFTFSGDKTTLPIQSYNGWDGQNDGGDRRTLAAIRNANRGV